MSALQLAERGKLSLDEKVSDVAPEIPVVNPWAATNPVTLAQLLEHTAGFDDFSLAEFYDFDASPDDPHPRPLLWTLTHFTGPEHVRWRPGSRTSYSNPGYGLAGYIVEKTAGVPLENYIAGNILRPLVMAHSDMRLTPAVKDALAQGYDTRKAGALLPDFSAARGRDEVVGERDGAIRPHDAESRRARRRQNRQSRNRSREWKRPRLRWPPAPA